MARQREDKPPAEETAPAAEDPEATEATGAEAIAAVYQETSGDPGVGADLEVTTGRAPEDDTPDQTYTDGGEA